MATAKKTAPWRLVPVNEYTGNTKGGKYHCTVDLRFDRFGISCMTTDSFYFYLQNKLIQISQTGGQWYSDNSPFSIPWNTFRPFLAIKNFLPSPYD